MFPKILNFDNIGNCKIMIVFLVYCTMQTPMNVLSVQMTSILFHGQTTTTLTFNNVHKINLIRSYMV
jgi:hypothetical protein